MKVKIWRSGEVANATVCKTVTHGCKSHLRLNVLLSPGGGIGLHARLKIVCRKACGFESRPGHIMIKAALFDVGGVLIDSFEANLKFFQNLMVKTGYASPTRESFRDIFPLNLPAAIKALTKNESAAELNRILQIAQSRETGYDVEQITTPPDAEKVLVALSKDYKLSIVTSRQYPYEAPALAKLPKYFQVTVSYADTKNHKPHPEPLLLAAQRLEVAPAECVYLGDAASDLQAGRAAKMKVIIYSKIKESRADAWTASFAQLPELVSSLA